MNISAAIRFPFRGPHAWPNFGFTLVCFLIPVVGPIVIMGYMVGVERALIADSAADAPRFDFGKFGFYLTRGVWPFLAALVLGLLALPVMVVMMGLGMGGIALTDRHPGIGIPMIVIAALGYFGAILLTNLVTIPLKFNAGLQESFGAAFDFRFLGDYAKRVGLLMMGIYLLFFLVIIPLSFLSLCCFFVGPYILSAISLFCHAHLQVQLYHEYLRRGGNAIPLKPEMPAPAFPVIPPP